MARFMPALHVYWEVRIFPYQFPVVRGIGQVARGNFALDARLGVASESDSSLKTLMTRGEPADKLKPTSGGLDLNEVFGINSHNRKKNIRISGKVNNKSHFFFLFNPRLNCSHVGRSASGIACHSFFWAWRIQFANSAFLIISLIFLFTLPAHEVVEPVIPLVMLFL